MPCHCAKESSEQRPANAPCWMNADEASAWADGWNAAIESMKPVPSQSSIKPVEGNRHKLERNPIGWSDS